MKRRMALRALRARGLRGRRALREPVCGNLRSQQRLDRGTLRGKLTVHSPWRLYSLVPHLEKLATDGLAG
jgi:hypothetical protein